MLLIFLTEGGTWGYMTGGSVMYLPASPNGGFLGDMMEQSKSPNDQNFTKLMRGLDK